MSLTKISRGTGKAEIRIGADRKFATARNNVAARISVVYGLIAKDV